jgi:hypothetical protein
MRGGFGGDHIGALAAVHPGATHFGSGHHHRRRGDYADRLLCEDTIMIDPACTRIGTAE